MPLVPVATPDGAKIGRLIWESGYSRVGFTRTVRDGVSARTIYNVINNNQRISVDLMRRIARALRVKPSEISDLSPEDDDIEDDVRELAS